MTGQKKLMINNQLWEYTGEIDLDGRACGFGSASCGEQIIEATFFDDLLEGVCKE